jgi:hypothetical protein
MISAPVSFAGGVRCVCEPDALALGAVAFGAVMLPFDAFAFAFVLAFPLCPIGQLLER